MTELLLQNWKKTNYQKFEIALKVLQDYQRDYDKLAEIEIRVDIKNKGNYNFIIGVRVKYI